MCRFSEGAVAFLDILGFENLIDLAEELDNPTELIQYVNEAFTNAFSRSHLHREQFKIKLFSDCISISTDPSPPNILMLIAITASIQRNLIQKGIALRGAVAFGKHFENENMIFSKALVLAHLLEKKFAVYPRVLIHSRIFDLLSNEQLTEHREKYGTTFISSDFDNYFYVDYLDNIRYMLETSADRSIYTLCVIVFQLHQKCILSYMEDIKAKTEIGQKYLWMANYHNRKVSECPIDESRKQELLITILP